MGESSPRLLIPEFDIDDEDYTDNYTCQKRKDSSLGCCPGLIRRLRHALRMRRSRLLTTKPTGQAGQSWVPATRGPLLRGSRNVPAPKQSVRRTLSKDEREDARLSKV